MIGSGQGKGGLCVKGMRLLKTGMRGLVALLPAVTLFGGYVSVPFLWPNATLAQVVPLALIAAALVWFFMGRGRRLPFGRARGAVLVFAWMAVYGALSLLWVKSIGYSFGIWQYQALGVVAVLAVAGTVKSERHLLAFCDVLTLCYAVVVAFGIYEIFTGYYVFDPQNPQLAFLNGYGRYFPYAVFANTNDYSTYLVLYFPFVCYGLTRRLPGVWGWLAAGLVCAAAALTLFNADPRVLYLALAFFALLFFACLLRKPHARANRKKVLGLLLAGAFCIGLPLLALSAEQNVFASEISSISMQNHSVSERLLLNLGALRMVSASHFLGVGVGNACMLMGYFSGSIKPFNVHNMTLQLLAEYGILIWVPYLLTLLWLAVRFFRLKGRSFGQDALAAACFALVCVWPVIGIASADMTHISAVWPAMGLLLTLTNVLEPDPPRKPGGRRMLFISFIDFGDFSSGSSVRPQRMARAFERLGYEVLLLSGLQNRRRARWARVWRTWRAMRVSPPDFCYVEPPSGPFFNFCDHLLLLWLHTRRVPIGLFYRDAYWRFADWWGVRGLKRLGLVCMHRFDLLVFRRCLSVVFFPTRRMARLFDFPREAVLPPAGVDLAAPPRPPARRALYIGGVSYAYGTDMMLEAFAFLNEQLRRGVHLTVVCREKEMGRFFDGYLGRPWLTVRHLSGDAALAPVYAENDLALYPSRPDRYMDFCMPVKLLEYLSRAMPVVCTPCAEAAAFVCENGFGVVAPFDSRGFARAVAKLFDEPGSLEKLREAGIQALRARNLWEHRAAQAARDICEAGPAPL